eukprot:11184569-Prorocentrum_lima.AAC.1
MTSSLVGSEMCIRDSDWGEWRRGKKNCSALFGGLRRVAVDRRTLPSSSVSYTHLTLPTICSV